MSKSKHVVVQEDDDDDDERSLDYHTIRGLLTPRSKTIFQSENERNPWNRTRVATPFNDVERPLLRLWDSFSGSQPMTGEISMEARAPRQRLDTFESRKTYLAAHVDHGILIPTPFISFTSSPAAVKNLAALRKNRRRRAQTLTVIDPNTRARDGLPTLQVLKEMNYYGIEDPYGNSNKYYTDHRVCLWEVRQREIVGHWEWEYITQNDRWYEEIILPAFEEYKMRGVETTTELPLKPKRA